MSSGQHSTRGDRERRDDRDRREDREERDRRDDRDRDRRDDRDRPRDRDRRDERRDGRERRPSVSQGGGSSRAVPIPQPRDPALAGGSEQRDIVSPMQQMAISTSYGTTTRESTQPATTVPTYSSFTRGTAPPVTTTATTAPYSSSTRNPAQQTATGAYSSSTRNPAQQVPPYSSSTRTPTQQTTPTYSTSTRNPAQPAATTASYSSSTPASVQQTTTTTAYSSSTRNPAQQVQTAASYGSSTRTPAQQTTTPAYSSSTRNPAQQTPTTAPYSSSTRDSSQQAATSTAYSSTPRNPAQQGMMAVPYSSSTRDTAQPLSTSTPYTSSARPLGHSAQQASTSVPHSSSNRGSTNPATIPPPQSSLYTRNAAAEGPTELARFRAIDPTSHEETLWEISPALRQAEAARISHRNLTYKRIRGYPSDSTVNQESRSRPLESEFQIGTVIEAVLVSPAAASGISRITPDDTFPEPSHRRLRRFVIIDVRPENRNSFQALTIKTYNGQGVAAPGVRKFHHCVIYTNALVDPTAAERPQLLPSGSYEDGMQPMPIRVIPRDRATALDPLSRLDFTDRYEFDYGVPHLTIFGHVHPNSQVPLRTQYQNVWATIRSAISGPGATASGGTSETPASSTVTQSSSASTIVPPTRQPAPPYPSTAPSARPSGEPQSRLSTAGPISEEQMRNVLRSLQRHAEQNELTVPGGLNPQQIRHLASNAAARETYLSRIRARWEEEEDDD